MRMLMVLIHDEGAPDIVWDGYRPISECDECCEPNTPIVTRLAERNPDSIYFEMELNQIFPGLPKVDL